MRASHTVLSLLLFASSLAPVMAQDPAAAKQLQELLKRAERAEQEGSTAFAQAETYYEEALALAPDHAEANMRMGLCQLNGPHRQQALPYLQKALALDPLRPRLHFLLGLALQLDGRWDEAIAQFDQHKRTNTFQDPDPLYNTADKHITECRNGKALSAAPSNALVTNVGPVINTSQADYGALVSADGNLMYFTTRRPADEKAKVNRNTGDYFEDVYESRRTPEGWSQAVALPPTINTAANDASVGLFNDARTMLLYRDHDGSGDLFECQRNGTEWSEPEAVGANVNTDGHESSAWYSFDRQWLYFVSDRPDDNVGGQDIYRSRWNAQASDWGVAENLGPVVNSIYDEEGVFVHPDGKTLYFSSKGHSSMGGYDIFRTRLEDGRWTKPENMGVPVNSPDDDLFFAITADGSTGYFSSFRKDGFGEDDIYKVEFQPTSAVGEATAQGGKAAPIAEEPSSVLIKGKIMSLQFLNGMAADIELMDLSDASLVARFRSDSKTGEYMVAVPAGRSYAMYIKANGYLIRSESITVPDGQRGLQMDLDVTLDALEAGSSVTMKNLYFATASAQLEQTSLADLGQLRELLLGNSALRLEISGHTDSDGTPEFNRTLSAARAEAVRDHLVAQGIAADRLATIGFGDTKPLAANDSDANKALNRRTEIKVL